MAVWKGWFQYSEAINWMPFVNIQKKFRIKSYKCQKIRWNVGQKALGFKLLFLSCVFLSDWSLLYICNSVDEINDLSIFKFVLIHSHYSAWKELLKTKHGNQNQINAN